MSIAVQNERQPQTCKNDRLPFINTWLFSENSFLERSPSRKFMTVEQELRTRLSIQDFILKLGTHLKLDYYTIFAATLYVHRFYMRVPITASKYYLASAAIAISTKLHDTYRQPDKIALVSCKIRGNGMPVGENSEAFWKWRDQLLFREEILLKFLNFELNLDFPYEIRDQLMEYEVVEEGLFMDRKQEIIKKVVASIEIVSALPLLVAYDMNTVFATMLIQSTYLAAIKFNHDRPKIAKPIMMVLGVDIGVCYRCHQYVCKLLSYCHIKETRFGAISNMADTIKPIPFDTFKEIAQV